ncbi:MAG TPA: FAD-dependent oxidoreductase [Acidobacteriaceae bacterium]|nr:FAD-dependent oxidoreductase [Acidobacteriaceae bacterium]
MGCADTAIAGGGIIGLATALELAAEGYKVTVFDKDEAMSEASRAAAGMLAGNDPENPPELRELARLSLQLYPDFLARVEELSGAKIPIRTNCTVQGAKQLPPGVRALSDAEVREFAPRVAMEEWYFFLLEEQSFDAWDLAEALPRAALAAGIELREHTAVQGVRSGNGGVEVETPAGVVPAGTFVNCAGAWSAALDALPVAPRKGHMLTATLPGLCQMRCVLRTPKVYIVPRGENRYTIGPTVESAGFDKQVLNERIEELLERAAELWPPLRDARISETWTGLRPGSEDGLPILDRIEANRWVATGHYKYGILLGPATGRVMSQWIQRNQPEVEISAFRAGRFDDSPVLSRHASLT